MSQTEYTVPVSSLSGQLVTGAVQGVTVKYVTYIRVSTKKQGDSGLGLDAQTAIIGLYLKQFSSQPWEVVADYVDATSGAGGLADRPVLLEAIDKAKAEGAVLLVAKLDRLSRDVEVIAGLMNRVEFKVASMPNADRFQLHIYAALAEQERHFISARTKDALAQAKARGVKLGGVRPGMAARNAGTAAKAAQDAERCRSALAAVAGKPLREQAQHLNAMNIKTARGGSWTATQVMRVRDRLAMTDIKSAQEAQEVEVRELSPVEQVVLDAINACIDAEGMLDKQSADDVGEWLQDQYDGLCARLMLMQKADGILDGMMKPITCHTKPNMLKKLHIARDILTKDARVHYPEFLA